jgi:hypothetical protein
MKRAGQKDQLVKKSCSKRSALMKRAVQTDQLRSENFFNSSLDRNES